MQHAREFSGTREKAAKHFLYVSNYPLVCRHLNKMVERSATLRTFHASDQTAPHLLRTSLRASEKALPETPSGCGIEKSDDENRNWTMPTRPIH